MLQFLYNLPIGEKMDEDFGTAEAMYAEALENFYVEREYEFWLEQYDLDSDYGDEDAGFEEGLFGWE